MADPKENIQARLAEYVEGTLDAAGRAEIERHLAEHAEHRQLIAELMGVRDALRELPRATAPHDMTESLQAQLERSALLGDGLDDGGLMKLNRWPQVLALAAIVILALGLGLVVYVTLPSSTPTAFTVVEKEVPAERGVGAPQGPVAEASIPRTTPPPASKQGPGDEWDALLRSSFARNGRDAAAPGSGEGGAGGGGAADAEPDRVASAHSFELGEQAANVPLARGKVQTISKDALPADLPVPPDNSMVVVMNSEDVRLTDDRVLALFRANSLQWERLEPAPDAVAQDAVAQDAVAQDVTSAITDTAAEPAPPVAVMPAQPSARPEIALGGTVTGQPGAEATEDQPVAERQRDGDILARREAKGALPADRDAGSGARGQASAPRAGIAESETGGEVLADRTPGRPPADGVSPAPGVAQPARIEAPAPIAVDPTQPAQAPREQVTQARQAQTVAEAQDLRQLAPTRRNQYVVRGITRSEASELLLHLSQDEALEYAQVYTDQPPLSRLPEHVMAQQLALPRQAPATRARGTEGYGDQATPANGPAQKSIRPGDELIIEVKELAANGVMPTLRQRVDASGSIKLPMLPNEVPAAGQTVEALQEAVARQYRDAKVIAEPTVIVRKQESAGQVGQAAADPAGQDTPLGLAGGEAVGLDGAAEERVDLVIVVQTPEAAAPTTRPAAAASARLSEGDRVLIRLPGLAVPAEEASATRRISAIGSVALPLVGPVPIAGLTPEEARAAIAKAYADVNLQVEPHIERVPEAAASEPAPSDTPVTHPAQEP